MLNPLFTLSFVQTCHDNDVFKLHHALRLQFPLLRWLCEVYGTVSQVRNARLAMRVRVVAPSQLSAPLALFSLCPDRPCVTAAPVVVKTKHLSSSVNYTNKQMSSVFYLWNLTHSCVQDSSAWRAHLYHLHVHSAPSVCQLAGRPRLTALRAPLASSAMKVAWQSQVDHAVQVWYY